MDYPFPVLKLRRLHSRGVFAALTLLMTSFGVQADTHSAVGSRSAGVCYCHCGMSKARSGCAKICETPKYASRWWATSCARPPARSILGRLANLRAPAARLGHPAVAIANPRRTGSHGGVRIGLHAERGHQ